MQGLKPTFPALAKSCQPGNSMGQGCELPRCLFRDGAGGIEALVRQRKIPSQSPATVHSPAELSPPQSGM